MKNKRGMMTAVLFAVTTTAFAQTDAMPEAGKVARAPGGKAKAAGFHAVFRR